MLWCKTICRNYVYTKSFNLLIGFKNLNIFIFTTVKMAAKYAEIARVGKLQADFKQVPHVQNFWNFHNIVMEQQEFKMRKNKKKNVFYY